MPKAAATAAAVGTLFDLNAKYELGEKLGRGQYGVVWRCTDRATGEAFACKYVAGESEHAIRGAQREVKSLLRLRGSHHVVALRDVYKDERNQSLYLVIELGSNGDLLSAIERKGRLSEADARRVFRDVVLGVKECHERGVLHRDIKPDNVLLFPTSTTDTNSRRTMPPTNNPLFNPSDSSPSPFGSSNLLLNGAASSRINNKGSFLHDDSLVQDYHGATRLGQRGLLLGDYSRDEAEAAAAAAAAAAAVAAAVADAGALSPRSHSAPYWTALADAGADICISSNGGGGGGGSGGGRRWEISMAAAAGAKGAEGAGSVAKLVDLGISIRLKPGHCVQGYAGSFPYEAPEVVAGTPYDYSADIFSLGVTLYAMLSGKWPSYASRILEEGSYGPSERRLDDKRDWSSPCWWFASKQAKKLIRRMMASDPDMRPTAEEILADPWLDPRSLVNTRHGSNGPCGGSASACCGCPSPSALRKSLAPRLLPRHRHRCCCGRHLWQSRSPSCSWRVRPQE